MTITNPTTPPVVGRYYRSADGSHRLDTGPSLVELEASSIFNITARRDYIHRPFGDWAVRSVLDAADLKPPKALSRAPVPTLYPYRLAIGKGQSGSLTATVGFSAYQIRWADGTTKLVVPELNLFAVSIRAPNGRTEVYSNIELVEPPASIFRAPADVAIQQLPGRRLMDSRGSTP